MVAAVAAEYFDEPLEAHWRELAHKIGRTPAVFAIGGFLIVDLLSRRGYHVTMSGDELGKSVKVGDRMTTGSRTTVIRLPELSPTSIHRSPRRAPHIRGLVP